MTTTPATVFACGLCGHGFTHGNQACSSCALGAGCALVRCPRCGYQFPRESLLETWFKWLYRRLGAGW